MDFLKNLIFLDAKAGKNTEKHYCLRTVTSLFAHLEMDRH
jgi:hypothetical protein